MIKNHTFAVIMILCGLITGCVHTIDRMRLNEITGQDMTMTVAEWWYMGSCDGYHYFANTGTKMGGTFRLSTNELQKFSWNMPFTKDRNKWILMPWGSPHPDHVHTIGHSRNDEADEREPVVDPLCDSPEDQP